MPLPKLTPNLYRIVVTKFRDPNPDHFDVLETLIYSFYHIEIRLREDYNLSLIFIFDCEGVNASHLLKLTPTLLKKVVFISQVITVGNVTHKSVGLNSTISENYNQQSACNSLH